MVAPTELPAFALPAGPERALPAGTRLDDFEIERVLAHSSFAVVYRAYDHALRLHVAVKEYLPDALALRSAETEVVLRDRMHAQSFEAGLQAFIGEAQTLARCEHPSLLRINRILQCHGTAYRVMRYCPGPTLLAHRRALAEAPDEKTLRDWLDGLLGALAALHEEGCVHAAVSPGNILLLPGDRPMLLDFDAVRTALISERTQGLMAALQPCFEAPEQRGPSADSAVGPWTDLYSLAATLHFCIGGQLPAPASDGPATKPPFEPLAEVWQRLRTGRPERPDAPALLAALDACLAPAPQDRPQSVAGLRALLGAPGVDRRAPAPVSLVPLQVAPTEPATLTPLAAVTAPAQVTAPEPATEPRLPIEPAAAAAAGKRIADADGARVIADLAQTFALVAAQANADALAAPAPASPPASASVLPADDTPGVAGPPPLPAASARPPRRPHPRWWRGGAAALLVLLAGAWWLSRPADSGERVTSASREAAPATPAAITAAAPAMPSAVPSAPLREASPDAGLRAPGSSPAGVAASSPVAPIAAEKDPKLAAPLADAKAPNSPRALCGKRTGYALYQCMQTQCAKRSLAKHAQCKRLKEGQSLG